MNLRIPGPTPCPPEVLQAMGKQMINHRGPEFAALIAEVTAGLKSVFQTQGDVLILTAAGTGGLEAAVVNTLSPGDRVLSVSVGVFGDRFADIAQTYGAEVVRLQVEWGRAADPEAVRQALKRDASIKALLLTHNETSTGVTNDLGSLCAVAREAGKLILVDGISSLGAIDLPVDDWGCDVVVSGSQKSWMVPPGLALVCVNKRAWEANAAARMPRFYWDFAKAKASLEKGQTPWTPALSQVFALQVALEVMLREGLPSIFARHERIGSRTRKGVKALGLELFADEDCASNTVTAVKVPEGLDGKLLNDTMRRDEGVVLAGGQGRLAGRIFRIGHLGFVREDEIDGALAALGRALSKLGYPAPALIG